MSTEVENKVLGEFDQVSRSPATHDIIAERLQKSKDGLPFDKKNAKIYCHKGIDCDLYVSTLGYTKHKHWHEMRRFEDIQHEEAKKKKSDPVDRRSSDAYILANAVYSEDGVPLGEELAGLLLDLKGGGPDTHLLLSLCEKENPPRESMAIEVAAMLNKSRFDLLLWRILIESGLCRVLMEYMSTHATDKQKERAKRQMLIAEEMVYVMQPLFEAEDISKVFGIEFDDAMTLFSLYGDDKAAIEEALASSQEE